VKELQEVLASGGFPRILDGGIEYEFYLPVRAGDILVASVMIEDIAEKEGKSGRMLVCQFQTTYLNQNGDLAAKSRQTFIAR
jgi:hydroxyacyl-ACP dehydratase HTD2-like protein with hotdog domain